jgi:hypothetical protein
MHGDSGYMHPRRIWREVESVRAENISLAPVHRIRSTHSYNLQHALFAAIVDCSCSVFCWYVMLYGIVTWSLEDCWAQGICPERGGCSVFSVHILSTVGYRGLGRLVFLPCGTHVKGIGSEAPLARETSVEILLLGLPMR